ncbi:FecCD family ABC transporter permease [Streptomyces sp. H39-C1]|uniref:FecCD family ABC transporter permease n=1 Tax=Streptomyces sp. H39-C1 TaxID=3004355 RepID=UPI0022B003FE|nr:iron chelate uptake ABC transporter family permease subunit [Streptomyces sp. H39-C1]MCZ4101762.1 iron chelate uptake ABC transporter family permease subunit [Streptomyces sp. H39-C1]
MKALTRRQDGAPRVDFGHRVMVLRPSAAVSVRLSVRTTVVCAILLLLTLVVGVLALGTGEFSLPPDQVVRALTGQESGWARLVVVEWRLPRVVLALLIGSALGLSGAVFQSLMRNPLGSPDVIGFNTGAYTGVLVATAYVGHDYAQTSVGALVGGLLTAAVVYLLAYRQGVQGFRLIIVGIAVSAVLGSVNQWFIIKADLQTAYAAALWDQGTLNDLSWDQVPPVAYAVGALSLLLVAMGPSLRLLELGDDAASALGVRREPVRLAYLAVGVALTAVATAAAGPISFVALAAPQIAARLTRAPGIALVPSAVTGALLLLVGDFLAVRLFAPTQLPVGVVTVSLGGAYFAWLLARNTRGRK